MVTKFSDLQQTGISSSTSDALKWCSFRTMKNRGYVSVRRLDDDFVEKGSQSTEPERLGRRPRSLWCSERQAQGCHRPGPGRGLFPPPPQSTVQPATEVPGSRPQVPMTENWKATGEKVSTFRTLRPPTTNSSWFFIPSLQSWVSPSWHDPHFRLDTAFLWEPVLALEQHPWPLSTKCQKNPSLQTLTAKNVFRYRNPPPIPSRSPLDPETTVLKRSPPVTRSWRPRSFPSASHTSLVNTGR